VLAGGRKGSSFKCIRMKDGIGYCPSLFSASDVRTVSSSKLADALGHNDPTEGVYHEQEVRS